jgi:hypothetical protein
VNVVEIMQEYKSDFCLADERQTKKKIPCEEVFYRPAMSCIQVMTSRPVPGRLAIMANTLLVSFHGTWARRPPR